MIITDPFFALSILAFATYELIEKRLYGGANLAVWKLLWGSMAAISIASVAIILSSIYSRFPDEFAPIFKITGDYGKVPDCMSAGGRTKTIP